MDIKSYDVGIFSFNDIIKTSLKEKDLTNIHLTTSKKYSLFSAVSDQDTHFHKLFYGTMYELFIPLYKKFVKEEITKHYKDFLYQKTPTFRIHLVNNLGVGEFHKDSDYNHSVDELNFFVPVTQAYDTNTIWIESKAGLEDYLPCNLSYGEYLSFDGANLKHGNKINKTNKTRISFDFRILSISSYEKNNEIKKSITQRKDMTIGSYWDVI